MSTEYPYIQKKTKIKDNCKKCGLLKDCYEIEWRVDWFQGNCEFETICYECLNFRTQEEKRKQNEYVKKMSPIWDKERVNREKREKVVEDIAKDLGLVIKKYDNGQWSFGTVLDWWTTTHTAIERKSKKRYALNFKEPQKIKSVLEGLV